MIDVQQKLNYTGRSNKTCTKKIIENTFQIYHHIWSFDVQTLVNPMIMRCWYKQYLGFVPTYVNQYYRNSAPEWLVRRLNESERSDLWLPHDKRLFASGRKKKAHTNSHPPPTTRLFPIKNAFNSAVCGIYVWSMMWELNTLSCLT